MLSCQYSNNKDKDNDNNPKRSLFFYKRCYLQQIKSHRKGGLSGRAGFEPLEPSSRYIVTPTVFM